ncbi:hypothetical protein D9M69_598620 [compost metagenome]
MELGIGPPAGEWRSYQATEGVAGAPEPHDPAALLAGKETAEVLAQPRPACGLGQALDQHAGGKDRQRGKGAHGQGRQGGDSQATQHDYAGAVAVRQDAPGELADGIGSQVDRVQVGHGHLVEVEGRVFGDAQLGDGECLAGEIEGGVGQPGNDEDLQAPTAYRASGVRGGG